MNKKEPKQPYKPVPFDDALRRILSAPPQPKKSDNPKKKIAKASK